MILLTEELRERLPANGRERNADHIPVVKFFSTLGEGVWLATEMDADGDAMFGLADLGYPELGSFSLLEMTSVRLPFGMGIERDILLATDLSDFGLGGSCPPGRKHSRRRKRPLPRRPIWPERRVRSQLEIRKAADAQSRVCGPVPLRIFGVRRSPQSERAAPFFVTGLEVERVSAARHGDSPHGYAQTEDHPQRLA